MRLHVTLPAWSSYSRRMRSNASQADMSERITRSPGEPVQDFDSVDRAASELHGHARRLAPSALSLNSADRALLLPERRPADEQHVVQALELDGAVDAEVGHGAFRQRARRARRPRCACRPARTDRCAPRGPRRCRCACRSRALAERTSLRLRLGDLHFGLEPSPGSPRAPGSSRRDLLADVDGHHLQHAGDAGAHAQLVHAAASSGPPGHAPGRRPTAARRFARAPASARDASCSSASCVADRQLFGFQLRLPPHEVADQLPFGQRLVHLRLHARLLVVGFDGRSRGALLQRVVLQCMRRFASAASAACSFSCGLLHFLFELRVRQLEDDGVGRDGRSGPHQDALDAPLRRRRNPADILGRRACPAREPGGPSARASRCRARAWMLRQWAPPASAAPRLTVAPPATTSAATRYDCTFDAPRESRPCDRATSMTARTTPPCAARGRSPKPGGSSSRARSSSCRRPPRVRL